MEFFNLIRRLNYSIFSGLIALFILSILIGGNQDRIGLSFVSLNALFSFFLIGWGLLMNRSIQNTHFVVYLLLILVFVALSSIIRNESFVGIYSAVGNLLLAYILYKNMTFNLMLVIVVTTFIMFSVVFITFYIPGVWSPFGTTNRLTYSGMNPNVVAEYITMAFLSGFSLLSIKKVSYSRMVVLFLLFVIAVIPLLSTVSRKGIILFFLCCGVFYILKYRKWNIGSLIIVALFAGGFFLSSELFIKQGDSKISNQLQERFYNEYETDADTRGFLLVTSVTKGLEKPIFGHGMESSRDPMFLKSIGLWNSARKSAINTHNGFVNLFLKGGIVFVILHLAIFFFLFGRLFRHIRDIQNHWLRDVAIMAFIYTLVFLAHILSSGNGELFKLGWFYMGFAAGVERCISFARNAMVQANLGRRV